jgi:nucleotide-binding universal stress UspA family protein
MTAAIVPIATPVSLKKILFATDFSDASAVPLPAVGALARRFHSQVVLVHVWSNLPPTMVHPEAAATIEERCKREVADAMQDVMRADVLDGIDARIELREGDPIETLIELVDAEKADLIVMGTHGRHGFKHFLIGSVAEGVIRRARCPVLTIGPHVDRRFSHPDAIANILVPTDLSADSRSALPYVAALACEFKARVHFLHVLPVETASNPQAEELFQPLKKRMEQELAREIPPSCQPELVVEFGEEAERIAAMAKKIEADLIVMGVRSTHWNVMNVRSSVAYKTIASASCPVLTVRHPV